MQNLYNEEYFMDSKFSNYKTYDERPYCQLAKDLIKILDLKCDDVTYDYGCATGKLCYHLFKEGNVHSYGYDISEWAIQHGKEIYPEIADNISTSSLPISTKAIICLDVLEHLRLEQVYATLRDMRDMKSRYLVVRIPVCKKMGEKFVLDCSNNDDTHINPMTKNMWAYIIQSFGFDYKGIIKEKDIYDSEGVFCALFENKTCDEVYFEGRGLEVKHFIDAIHWKEFFKPESAIEFGCGKGPRVFAMNHTGINCVGMEISKFAVDNSLYGGIEIGDVTKDWQGHHQLVIAYDLLEHINYENLDLAISNIVTHSLQYILVSIPFKGTPDCENDPTHIIKEDRDWWRQKFLDKGLKEVKVPEHFLFRRQLLIFEK